MLASQVRVLIVDDHPVIRNGLVELLGEIGGIVVVDAASSGREALAQIARHQPDVTILDLSLPDMTGTEVIAASRSIQPEGRFLMLTIHDTLDEIERALHVGARGYVLKDCRIEELAAAVRAIHAGGRYFSAAVGSRLAEQVGDEALTLRELEVMRLLAAGKRDREIARVLQVRESTVRTHLSSIYAKLGVRSRTEAILAALRRRLVAALF